MTLCFVTDRRRLCGEDAPFDAARRRLATLAARAIDRGVGLIQIRERDLDAGPLAILVKEIVGMARGTATRVVVNDRLDVALACGADGVHLRGDSMPASAVRRIAPASFLVGRSIHSVSQAIDAGPVDYLIAGTVFETPSKPAGHPLIGVEGLRAIARAARAPVLAIGGVTADRLDEVLAAGAAGAAGIGLFDSMNPTP